MKYIAILVGTIALSGCSTEFSVPVTGEIGNTPAQGTATARLNGDGTFKVANLDGLTCQGDYDALDNSPTITTDATCSDGRTGKLIITRTLNGLSGTVIGRLSDGTNARFVFGDLTFGQAFNNGGQASIRQ